MMHDGWMYGMGWGWILLIAVLGLLIWFAMRAVRPGQALSGRPPASSPEMLLKDLFARGEISKEEYRARLEALRDPS